MWEWKSLQFYFQVLVSFITFRFVEQRIWVKHKTINFKGLLLLTASLILSTAYFENNIRRCYCSIRDGSKLQDSKEFVALFILWIDIPITSVKSAFLTKILETVTLICITWFNEWSNGNGIMKGHSKVRKIAISCADVGN